jgi:hypothetical protein
MYLKTDIEQGEMRQFICRFATDYSGFYSVSQIIIETLVKMACFPGRRCLLTSGWRWYHLQLKTMIYLLLRTIRNRSYCLEGEK